MLADFEKEIFICCLCISLKLIPEYQSPWSLKYRGTVNRNMLLTGSPAYSERLRTTFQILIIIKYFEQQKNLFCIFFRVTIGQEIFWAEHCGQYRLGAERCGQDKPLFGVRLG